MINDNPVFANGYTATGFGTEDKPILIKTVTIEKTSS